jgi:hypothetical protein
VPRPGTISADIHALAKQGLNSAQIAAALGRKRALIAAFHTCCFAVEQIDRITVLRSDRSRYLLTKLADAPRHAIKNARSQFTEGWDGASEHERKLLWQQIRRRGANGGRSPPYFLPLVPSSRTLFSRLSADTRSDFSQWLSLGWALRESQDVRLQPSFRQITAR